MSQQDPSRLGRTVPDCPATPPSHNITLLGRYVTVVGVHPKHASELYTAVESPDNASLFDYLFDEHPESLASLESQLAIKASTTDPWTYTILLNGEMGETPRAVGMSSLMRMDLSNRVIEVGSILFTPALQRTPAATEAMFLLARYVFEDLGFRRYEWKCNSLNKPSRRAAERLGFTYEGTFRQHMIARGRNRDTAWFSMLDSEWPEVKRAFEAWLSRSNFDSDGQQKKRLAELRYV
ncbi:acetyltransferase [Stagonosporopsis vannaccii]|nr:acetyltransferase [Stagonosporopsis vannaccii]